MFMMLERANIEALCAEKVKMNGFAMAQGAAGEALLDQFLEALAEMHVNDGAIPGVRGLLALSNRCRELVADAALLGLAQAVLGPKARAVKGIFFDKNAASNWLVPWHQDVTITVRERREAPGFGPWTMKHGLVHVQPPAAIMESIIALRIHIDDTGSDNGALRVLPGTHRQGRIAAAEISKYVDGAEPMTCVAQRGDVLLMHPLLLHSSLPSQTPTHRRVVHIEYSAVDLPYGLAWDS
ncbi:MAG TPA: phytanoyl-CoA dioxygenase family protein [Opitutales bacterium]|jgi:ectoine hydroxylase-related dioxygenase (phytanoyl-CoA dioxygenase family)|nr:phytanoyl-CoA dioxygenase family protein [Opitutales bacterium]